MSFTKYYCFGCYRPNNCKCGKAEKRFPISNKLRPPLTLKNKNEWRLFLNACPQFTNMIFYSNQHLIPDLEIFLRKIKYKLIRNGVIYGN
jgi:hypothetical protein